MLGRLFSRNSDDPRPRAIYSAIVAGSRQGAFYSEFGVPDTVEGRFEMLVLHGALVTAALRGAGEEGRDLAQKVFDLTFAELDRSLRELGVSDMSVPKKIRAMAEAFYGRARAYLAALEPDAPGEALPAVLARNVLSDDGPDQNPTCLEGLAAYVRAAHGNLTNAEPADLLAGVPAFPDAADFLAATAPG